MLIQDGETTTSKRRKRRHQTKGNSPGDKRLHQSTVSGVRRPWTRWWRGGCGLSDTNDGWRQDFYADSHLWLAPRSPVRLGAAPGAKGGTLKSCKRSGPRCARGQAASLTEVLLHFIFHGNFTNCVPNLLKPIKKKSLNPPKTLAKKIVFQFLGPTPH